MEEEKKKYKTPFYSKLDRVCKLIYMFDALPVPSEGQSMPATAKGASEQGKGLLLSL